MINPVPIDPCGQVMDAIRYCYEADCQFGTDDSQTSRIQWYRSARGALIFPGPHSFASSLWYHQEPHEGIGERDHKPSDWRDGSFPEVVPGIGPPCGPLPVFFSGWPGPTPLGLIRDPNGLAICCPTGGRTAGGVQLGGSSEVVRPHVGAGGSSVGGNADLLRPNDRDGGIDFGGLLELLRYLSREGGPLLGGLRDLYRYLARAGGGNLGGSSPPPRQLDQPGGSNMGGSSPPRRQLDQPGGSNMGGSSPLPRPIDRPGGSNMGGSSPLPRQLEGPGGMDCGGLRDFVPVLDLFDDVDNTILTAHTPNVGGPWTVFQYSSTGSPSDLIIGGNRLYNKNTVAQSIMYPLIDAGTADGLAQCFFQLSPRTGSQGGDFGILGRAADGNNLYYVSGFATNTSNGWSIGKAVAGVYTTLTSTTGPNLLDTEIYTLQLRIKGTAISATLSGPGITTKTITATDSSLTSGTKWGMDMNVNVPIGVGLPTYITRFVVSKA